MNKNLRLGDIVFLSENSKWVKERKTPMNPIGCAGSVGLPETPGWVTVCWENGYKNYYDKNDSDLILVCRI